MTILLLLLFIFSKLTFIYILEIDFKYAESLNQKQIPGLNKHCINSQGKGEYGELPLGVLIKN